MTPFIRELTTQKSALVSPLLHANFLSTLLQLKELGRLDFGGSIVAITGPSQAGKSLLLAQFMRFLMDEVFIRSCESEIPIVGATAQTSREGRTTPKYIYEMLLADCGSPIFDLQKIVQAKYRPSTSMSEPKMIVNLSQALRYLATKYVVIDEAQYLVRSKDANFRSTLLESLKSLVSGTRSLVLVGGYEFLETLLKYQAHLAARSSIIHLARYTSSAEDRNAWLQILKTISHSRALRLTSDRLLLDCSEDLLKECHGVVGVLLSRLRAAQMIAVARGGPIDANAIDQSKPAAKQWKTIADDIEFGENLLRPVKLEEETSKEGTTVQPASTPARSTNGRTPFTTNPRREMARFKSG